jgi:membrane-associated protease RseP (regulator of RpoE activity)
MVDSPSYRYLASLAVMAATVSLAVPARGQDPAAGSPPPTQAAAKAFYRVDLDARDPSGGQQPATGNNTQLLYDALVNQPVQNLFVAGMPPDPGTGAALEPADEAIRVQLDLPKGQGLVVTGVTPDGPAAQAGLQAHDILLSLAGKPLSQPDDIAKILKAGGDQEVSLALIRAGKPTTLQVKPHYRVGLGPGGQQRTDYYIGVPVRPLDDTLRAHLGLPAGEGLVVNEVMPNSPAAKAGVKPHDILIAAGDKALPDAQVLVAVVQASEGKPFDLKVVRGGKTQAISVTPERRPVQALTTAVPNSPLPRAPMWQGADNAPRNFMVWGNPTGRPLTQQDALNWTQQMQMQPFPGALMSGPGGGDKRVDALVEEMKALRKSIEQLQRSLAKERRLKQE